jgi:hypothetical protein
VLSAGDPACVAQERRTYGTQGLGRGRRPGPSADKAHLRHILRKSSDHKCQRNVAE